MNRLSVALLCGASAVGYGSQALAQTAPPTTADEQANIPLLEAVTITGSRVITNGNASPSPVTVVSTDDLLRVQPGSSLADALNTLPAFAGSRSSSSNPTTTGPGSGGNSAANQLNLRNLGPGRTLILMDGKRVAPTLFNGIVDVDIVPQALVQRIDVVTGGVSAVYGSDAMAGVVNYVIDHKLQGFRGDASYGLTQLHDGSRADVSLAYGARLGDRAHFEVSYEYRREGGIDRRSDRSWLNQIGVTGAGTTANPYVLQTNLHQAKFPFGGLITSGTLTDKVFKSNGVLSALTPGTATGTAAIELGGDGGYWDSSLLTRMKGNQLFGRFDFDLTEGIQTYVQFSGNQKTNADAEDYTQLSGVTLSRTNAFLPASIQALIPATETTFKMNQLLSEIPRAAATADSRQLIYAAGIAGKAGGAAWNVDYTHGVTKLSTAIANSANRQHLGYALDAVSSGGQVVCNVTLTNPGLANDCVPFNVFGPTAASAAAIDYVTDTVQYDATTKLDDISAQLGGSPFSTWAGAVNAALSGEWRKIAFSSTSSSTPDDIVNCTGIRFSNCTAGAVLTDFTFGQNPGGVSQTVGEMATEFDAPILKESRLLGSANLNGAARYTHYDTSGNYWTWKIGLDWRLSDSLRFRATRSQDIRAPTLFDLFAPTSTVQVRPVDLLTQTSPTVPQFVSSNPALTAEIGHTLTAGMVWKPAPGLSFAVDGYKIKISNAITSINGSTAAFQSACYASGGSSPYCALQVRPGGFKSTAASNAVQAWRVQSVNISEIETWGVDFEGNYQTTLLNRPLAMRVLSAYQPHVYYRQPNVTTIDQGGVGFGPSGLGATPSVRITAFLQFQPTERFSINVQERWRNAMKLSGDPDLVFASNHIGGFATTGLNLAWDLKNKLARMQLYANIQNLFDATPPIGAYSGNGTRAGLRDGFAIGDDPRGRYFTVGARSQF